MRQHPRSLLQKLRHKVDADSFFTQQEVASRDPSRFLRLSLILRRDTGKSYPPRSHSRRLGAWGCRLLLESSSSPLTSRFPSLSSACHHSHLIATHLSETKPWWPNTLASCQHQPKLALSASDAGHNLAQLHAFLQHLPPGGSSKCAPPAHLQQTAERLTRGTVGNLQSAIDWHQRTSTLRR